MFGLQFLFSAALWALPVAALPLVLHLLFNQKSRVIPFSTVRFIQASLKENATRRKVQRWLLLGCRALLLALLIWALAQPARQLAAGSVAQNSSIAAAIVADTSYSMLLQDQQSTLLHKEDLAIQDLLRTELRDANVAIFRSNSGDAPQLQPASAYRGEHWAELTPTPASGPLVDRVAAAEQMLAGADEDQKWLVILTDAQDKEFPRPITPLATSAGGQTILIDLHPDDVRAAAITNVETDPPQARLGIPAQVVINLAGHPNDTRQTILEMTAVDQADTQPAAAPLPAPPPLPIARFDTAGRAQLRTPMSFGGSSWLLVTARLDGPQQLPWAATRSRLVHVPARANAAILAVGEPNTQTLKLLRLALDPSEGQRAAWPVNVLDGPPRWDESLIIAVFNQWPDQATAERLGGFVRGGGSLVVFVQPGLEASWAALEPARQAAIAALLPSRPQDAAQSANAADNGDAAYHASIVRPSDEILADIGTVGDAEGRLVVTRLVHFAAGDPDVQPIINAAPNDPDSNAKLTGLLWRRNLSDGVVYTWATLPDRTCGNLRVWDLFPPTLVNALRPAAVSTAALNVELGDPLVLPAEEAPPETEVDLTPPGQEAIKISRTGDRYIYPSAAIPGLYVWRWHSATGESKAFAWTNVQPPSSEALLRYRALNEIAPPQAGLLAVHSLDEARRLLTAMNEPRPQWTLPIAIVLLLLCLEALLGAMPKRGSKRSGRLPGDMSGGDFSTPTYASAADNR
ncbi:MAG: BatA domain-containing protein [Tepidisphaeraceae bacterium]|jgi:hypothetical protein